MNHSLRSRIFRLTFFINIVFSGLILTFSWWSLEQLEQSVFTSNLSAEMNYFTVNGDKSRPQKIITSQITAAFIPAGQQGGEHLPVLFENLPVPYQGEIDFLGKEYFVITQTLSEGNYYLAKSLDLYEEREDQLTVYVLVLGLMLVCCCFIIAAVFSRRISSPTLLLAQHIAELDYQQTESRLTAVYVDNELNQIAAALNNLLEQIQDASQRERSLISMASHELRTPVAVVLGAARVLEKRNQLNPQDKTTLERIIQASEEMGDNIRALLAVVKQNPDDLKIEDFDIRLLVEDLIHHYQFQGGVDTERLLLKHDSPAVWVHADKALVRMMLHNLISNALSHTSEHVSIECNSRGFQIEDQGFGSESETPRGNLNLPTELKPSSGLGLYIVTLICERLQWKLAIDPQDNGHKITILF